MSKYDDYTDTTNPDNRFRYLNIEKPDKIIIGGSCTHIFVLPLKYSTQVKSAKIIYKQGLDVILEINVIASMIQEDAPCSGKTTITLNLTPLQTQLFDDSILDTFCQVKLITNNDEILYDVPHPIKVVSPLKKEPLVGE